jgi:DNA-binding transcriptional LysR family regulator
MGYGPGFVRRRRYLAGRLAGAKSRWQKLMTLDQLRIFVAVAERQHVTQAARALNVAQSAASHAIAALEARHDTKLFDRVGRRIELTEAGHAFSRRHGRSWRAPRRPSWHSANSVAEAGTLVYASQTIASYWLPGTWSRFGRPIGRSRFELRSATQPKSRRRSRAGSQN